MRKERKAVIDRLLAGIAATSAVNSVPLGCIGSLGAKTPGQFPGTGNQHLVMKENGQRPQKLYTRSNDCA